MWHLCEFLRNFQFDRCCKYLKYNEVKSEVEEGAGRAPQTLLDNFSRHNIFFHSLLKYHIERNTFTLSYLFIVWFFSCNYTLGNLSKAT